MMDPIQFARGYLGYYITPKRRDRWGGPFNGQAIRPKIFEEIVRAIGFKAIVETGTYKGVTTEFMHRASGLPVHSVESHSRYYGYACARLRRYREVRLTLSDSREFLRECVSAMLSHGADTLFYLDAHWKEDLPLADELRIIFSAGGRAVVMVDDFQVADDAGYGYDDYGPGKRLTLDYIEPVVKEFGLHCFFPAGSSDQETASRRGCIVLASEQSAVKALQACKSLREWRAIVAA